MSDKPSIVLGLVATVYVHHPPKSRHGGGARSFRRLNAALHDVLRAAITASLPFELDDFGAIYDRCGGSYWFGLPGGERFYDDAVNADNLSACLSFEHWKGRKPFIWHGKRLYIGMRRRCSFEWEGHSVQVTSFADDGLSLTAYSPGQNACKPSRRFTITHKQLRAAMKALRSQDIRVKIGTMPAGIFRLVGTTKLPRVGDRFTVIEDGKKARLSCDKIQVVLGEPLFCAERW